VSLRFLVPTVWNSITFLPRPKPQSSCNARSDCAYSCQPIRFPLRLRMYVANPGTIDVAREPSSTSMFKVCFVFEYLLLLPRPAAPAAPSPHKGETSTLRPGVSSLHLHYRLYGIFPCESLFFFRKFFLSSLTIGLLTVPGRTTSIFRAAPFGR